MNHWMSDAERLAKKNGWVRNAETGAIIRPALRNERVLCEIFAERDGGNNDERCCNAAIKNDLPQEQSCNNSDDPRCYK